VTPIELIVADMRALDAQSDDLLVLGVLEDERPLVGLAGLVDWRLCGALSRWIVSGFATGVWGESVLYPSSTRLAQRVTLVLGLGTRPQLRTDRIHDAARRAAEVMGGLGSKRMTCDLLGLDRMPTPIENTLPGLLEVLQKCEHIERVTLAVEPAQYEAVRAIMDKFGRRGFPPTS
jgi:hypothetical protein